MGPSSLPSGKKAYKNHPKPGGVGGNSVLRRYLELLGSVGSNLVSYVANMDLWQLWQEVLYLWVNFEDLAFESCSTLILAPQVPQILAWTRGAKYLNSPPPIGPVVKQCKNCR